MADYGAATRIWPVSTSGRLGPPTTLNIVKVSLAVADGAIWLAGYDTGDGILMRLNPRTLRPLLHSPLDPGLAPGAVLVVCTLVFLIGFRPEPAAPEAVAGEKPAPDGDLAPAPPPQQDVIPATELAVGAPAHPPQALADDDRHLIAVGGVVDQAVRDDREQDVAMAIGVL